MDNIFFKEDAPYEDSYYTLEEIEHLEQVDSERCKNDYKVNMSILKLFADDICNDENL